MLDTMERRTMTVLRGKAMMQDGRFLGGSGDGRMLKRKVAESVLSRPSV